MPRTPWMGHALQQHGEDILRSACPAVRERSPHLVARQQQLSIRNARNERRNVLVTSRTHLSRRQSDTQTQSHRVPCPFQSVSITHARRPCLCVSSFVVLGRGKPTSAFVYLSSAVITHTPCLGNKRWKRPVPSRQESSGPVVVSDHLLHDYQAFKHMVPIVVFHLQAQAM